VRTLGVIGRRTAALGAGLVVVLGLLAGPASAQSLGQRLDRALTVSGVSRAKTGAFALDLRNGRVVLSSNATRSLEPASNQKLAVAVAALERLRAGYRIPTEVLATGTRSGTTWRGRIFLKGYGDPTLTRGDLRTLARAVRNQGIRRVVGSVAGDESYFDARRVAPGWRPSWYKIESPPLSALVVNRAKVSGRTVDNPALSAARQFRDALRAAGVAVTGSAIVRSAPATATYMTRIRSVTAGMLLRKMNKTSDNFFAEVFVKHLGAKFRGAGTTVAGCLVVRRVLEGRGVPMSGVRLADGSGLSLRDRFTSRALGRLLTSAWRDPFVRGPLVASLPIAGVDGTLKDRMRSGPARRRVRAKTGTTFGASSLSGYVGSRYVFSIVQNGSRIPWENARRAQDRFAQVLAATL
jgi:D-alanyl-D-alanine carboxypeptidase/D-alanyl-D-alanine-endopeptidase (penicillin-binding protein 4)